MKKGLARLIFLIVFLLPVAWYIFLQGFGNNTFKLEVAQSIDNNCGIFTKIMVIRKDDSISIAKKNYLDRVVFGCNKRSIRIEIKNQDFFVCINQSGADMVIIDESGLWGQYELSREGVDLLLTELDVLLLQKSYGK